jgi:hypothetical protein
MGLVPVCPGALKHPPLVLPVVDMHLNQIPKLTEQDIPSPPLLLPSG